MPERCVQAYNAVGRVAEGLRLAASQLTEQETRDIYIPLANQLRNEKQFRKAEQIYVGLGEPDEAISMYKVYFFKHKIAFCALTTYFSFKPWYKISVYYK